MVRVRPRQILMEMRTGMPTERQRQTQKQKQMATETLRLMQMGKEIQKGI